MSKYLRYILVFCLFIALVLVRAFQDKLFYDPFTTYFKNDYLKMRLPSYDTMQLFSNLFFRYFLNTILSLLLIYLIFQNKKSIKFLIKFYAFAFIILGTSFFILLTTNTKNEYLGIFYIRRFLIQPIFVLLLIPAFYYQKSQKSNSN